MENRILKFRAFDDGKMLTMPLDTYYGMSRFFGLLSEDAIVMQFTGLIDKNGKEIYEGDILKSEFGTESPTEIKFGEYSGDKAYSSSTSIGFYWNESDGSQCEFGKSINGDMLYCDVLGNIYENPELLTK